MRAARRRGLSWASWTPLARAGAASVRERQAWLTPAINSFAIVKGPVSPRGPRDLDAARAALAQLVGAVTLGRACTEALSQRIADAAGRALLGAHWPGAGRV